MKEDYKRKVRCFILEQLKIKDPLELDDRLQEVCPDAEGFEAMLFYDEQIERIRKLFLYPDTP